MAEKKSVKTARRSAKLVLSKGAYRDKIIQVAGSHFAKFGFHGTSLSGIADEAGMNVSLLSYHFGNKEGLYRQLVQLCVTEIGAIFRKDIVKPRNKDEYYFRLRAFLQDIVYFNLKNPNLAKIMFREFDLETDVASDIFKKEFLPIYQDLVTYLRDGIRNGFVSSKYNAGYLATNLFSSLSGFLRWSGFVERYLRGSMGDDRYREEYVTQWLDVVEAGMRCREG